MEWEGEDKPQPSAHDALALEAWALLGNGMGGIDWAGLPLVAALLGVSDVERLVHALRVLRTHQPPGRPGS